MFRPKLRKVALKRALDGTLYRAVPRCAALAIGASERERQELEAVVPPDRVVVRPNGLPAPYDPPSRPGPLRSRLGLDATTPLVLSVGRVARGKGLEQLVAAVASLERGSARDRRADDGHGLLPELLALRDRLGARGTRALARRRSSHRSTSTATQTSSRFLRTRELRHGRGRGRCRGNRSVVSDRCGVAEVMRDRGALVVPYGEASLQGLLRDCSGTRSCARCSDEAAAKWRQSSRGRTSPGFRPRSTNASYDRPRGRHSGSAFRRRCGRADTGVRARRTRARSRAGAPAPTLRAAHGLSCAARGIAPAGAGSPAGAERVGRGCRAPYGDAALRSGRPYAAWIATSLDEEWAARRPHLKPSRRLALELNAPLLRRLERRVLRGATRLYATSPSARAGLAATAGLDPATIAILPIPVDTALYRPGR